MMDFLINKKRNLVFFIGLITFAWGFAIALLWSIYNSSDLFQAGPLSNLVDFLNTFSGNVFRNFITLLGIGHCLWLISRLASSVQIIRLKILVGTLAGIFLAAGLQRFMEPAIIVSGIIWGVLPLLGAYIAVRGADGLHLVFLRLLVSGLFIGQFGIFCFHTINDAGFAMVRIMGAPLWSVILVPSIIAGLVSGIGLGALCGIYTFMSTAHLAGRSVGRPRLTLTLSVILISGLVCAGVFVNVVFGNGINELRSIVRGINSSPSDRVDILLQSDGGLRRQIDGDWLNGGSITDWEASTGALKRFIAVYPNSVFRQDARMILGRLALARWDVETARNAFENYTLNSTGDVSRADVYLLACYELEGDMDALLGQAEKLRRFGNFEYPWKRLALMFSMAAIRADELDAADKYMKEAEDGLAKDRFGGVRPAVGRDADLLRIKDNLRLKLQQSRIHGSDFSVEGTVKVQGGTPEGILLGLYPMAARNIRSRDASPVSLFPNWWTSDYILTITDEKGFYEFENVPPGEYYIFLSMDAERLKNKTAKAPRMPVIIPNLKRASSVSLDPIRFVDRINVLTPSPGTIVKQRLPDLRWSDVPGAAFYTVLLVRSNPGSLNYAGYTCWGRPYIQGNSFTIDRDGFWKFGDKALNAESNDRALMPGEDYTPVVFAFDKDNRLIGSSEDYTGDLTQTFMVDMNAK